MTKPVTVAAICRLFAEEQFPRKLFDHTNPPGIKVLHNSDSPCHNAGLYSIWITVGVDWLVRRHHWLYSEIALRILRGEPGRGDSGTYYFVLW